MIDSSARTEKDMVTRRRRRKGRKRLVHGQDDKKTDKQGQTKTEKGRRMKKYPEWHTVLPLIHTHHLWVGLLQLQ